ncbi:epoxide hydrolase [Colletotrichum incanum]|uniref:Epoxide hydrolase n=1 Tax=Colletotrichum incanum TaxID=1573173 RepID=A0A161VZ18_COLIC|nr:epoxide hydrolase [Colletotrichum incanum]
MHMTDVLGYSWFVTQGGDFGSFITRSIAIQFPQAVRAAHLNMFPVPPPTLWSAPAAYLRWWLSKILYSDFEREALRVWKNFEVDQSGYLEQQRTRPQTLGFALGDSPIGLLAWFLEKFHDWADIYEDLGDDDLVTLVMMHWVQGATPGLRFYREASGVKREAEKTFETYVAAPTGVSMYAKEQLHVMSERLGAPSGKHPVLEEYERGGHFSSLECPHMFVKDMREFFSSPVVLEFIQKGGSVFS